MLGGHGVALGACAAWRLFVVVLVPAPARQSRSPLALGPLAFGPLAFARYRVRPSW